jgi:DNA-binding SARP family transcriptional activator
LPIAERWLNDVPLCGVRRYARSRKVLEFRILGPLEARGGDTPLSLGTPKQRAVLAYLLLHRNALVSSERLVQALWGERPPARAINTVQVYVSRLRKLLANETAHDVRIETVAGGYRLELEPGALDLDRFEALYEEGSAALQYGDTRAAAAKLEEALALWHGAPLADFAFQEWAEDEIRRLEERRLLCVERRLEAELEAGRHGDAVPELEQLVREYPLRERLRALLMVGLYWSGRQADALGAYRDARQTLRDQLGLEPSPELKRLEQRILRQEVDLAPPRATDGARGAPDQPDVGFIGRAHEVEVFDETYRAVAAGRPRMILLVGEPGIGKSRTAAEFARRAAGRGAEVLWGRCYETEGTPPYWPWVQAIRGYVRKADAHRLRGELSNGAVEVARLVPAVREQFPDLPPTVRAHGDPKQERFRVFDAIATFLRNASASHSLVLVLDDLHWADNDSLLLLEFVAHELGSGHVLIVGTYRDVDVSGRDPLFRTLAELTREQLVERLVLRGLSHEDVARLIRTAAGAETPLQLVEAIHARTGGNPLFVAEVARLLAPEQLAGGQDAMPSGPLFIPEGVRAVIQQRLDRLSEECNRALTIASVIGAEFSFVELHLLLDGVPEEGLLRVLEEALGARVLEEPAATPGRYAFAHALIRETLAEELSANRRARLHGRIAGVLEALYGDAAAEHAAALAYHFAEAATVVGPEKIVLYSGVAGERALAAHAFDEAVAHFERALEARADGAMDQEAARLLVGLVRAELGARELYELGPSLDRLCHAFAYYDDVGDQDHAVAVAIQQIPPVWEPTQIPQIVERALTFVPADSLDAGSLLSTAGWFLASHEGDRDAAATAFERSLAIARGHGDGALERRTLVTAAHAHYWHMEWQECRALGVQAIELALAADDQRTEMSAHEWPARVGAIEGDLPVAKRHAAAAVRLAQKLRERYELANAYMYSGWLYALEGDWAEARRFSNQALGLQPREPRNLSTRALLELQQGAAAEGEEYLAQLLDPARVTRWSLLEKFAMAGFIPMAGRVTQDSERIDLARETAEAALAATGMPPFMRLYGRLGLAFIAVERADAALAQEQYAAFLSQRGTAVMMAGVAVDRLLGLLASVLGHQQMAFAHFEDALAFCERAGYRPEYAWAAADYAECLRSGGDPGADDRADILDGRAAAAAHALGMKPLVDRISSRDTGRG